MKVILSIKPEFVNKIISGEKRFEFRRKIFKKDVENVIVYATAPIKAVVGEFTIDEILSYELNILWELTHKESGITKSFFYEYFKRVEIGHAIKIKKFYKYSKFLELEKFRIKFPPQSYVYVL